ncbi:MAG: ABC transporter permease subunit [Acidimicrobiia bacterium]|nr:ABC transporter permease subunit [Acidimicrobiia bacterium]NNF89691.1 ABC transporter permease subunit [Acidimicrobiia bacterium]NNL14186.1 ABC transporter permease subunit [Acidimicrobiia bacterium]NNL48879.1 ABC transporter permease subunit [Acidimicrobiia bacterium]NNL97861.1 ABC transporter permease subunit [Acidimicrobiia bacterium]
MALEQKPGNTEVGTPVVGLDGGEEMPSIELTDPLWRIRLRLLWRNFKKNWSLFAENRIGLIGLFIIGAFALMAIAHPILMATVWGGDNKEIYDPVIGYDAVVIDYLVVEEVNDPLTEIELIDARFTNINAKVGDTISQPQQPARPSSAHLLGTDPLGRDVLSQLMFSTRAAFFLGMVAALVTVFIATTVGSVAAFFRGFVDSFLMRIADLILLMPLIPILIVIGGFWTIELWQLGVIIGILNGFGGVAIVLRSQALAVSVKPFVDAARVAGGSRWHLIFRHVIPNVLPLSFLYMMFGVTEAISLEAVLSFFGLLNVEMSWGLMISIAQAEGYLLRGLDVWWLLFPAGMAVSVLAAAFFLVGRAMDEVVNPRLRKR